MDAHGWTMKGNLNTNNVRSQDGILSIEIDNTTGKTTLKNDLVIESGGPSNGKVLKATDSDGNVEFDNPSIPSGEIILFESDTAVTGYSLLTNVDDGVVYITKGSAAGGENGATAKTGGTWTQPNHNHTLGSHTHTLGSHTHTTGDHTLTVAEMPSHTHDAMDGAGGNNTNSITQGGGNFSGQDSQNTWRSSSIYDLIRTTGGDGSHNHGSTGAASGSTGAASGSTGNGATANTWRPTGRNFTRQQKD